MKENELYVRTQNTFLTSTFRDSLAATVVIDVFHIKELQNIAIKVNIWENFVFHKIVYIQPTYMNEILLWNDKKVKIVIHLNVIHYSVCTKKKKIL